MTRVLVLPPDFADYAWEVEAKGWCEAVVKIAGSAVAVSFYDRVRLAQDVESELAVRSAFTVRRLLVVPAVTRIEMELALSSVGDDFFR